jgi:polyisoprenoid-binding protein YceI
MKSDILILAGIAVLGAVPASAARFTVRPGFDDNRVVFSSKAPMESFEGKTGQVQGSLEFDPAALGDSVTFEFEVDLASLDTGLALRNKHMRENHLQTAKYPKAVFRGGGVTDASGSTLNPGETVTLALTGTFDLHGVSRRISMPVKATRRADGALGIVARFPVPLSEYNIDRPKFLVMKLDEIQQVTVTLTALPQP